MVVNRAASAPSRASALYDSIVTKSENPLLTELKGQVHHLVPLCLGGGHQESNLAVVEGHATTRRAPSPEDALARADDTAHQVLHDLIDETEVEKLIGSRSKSTPLDWGSLASAFDPSALSVLVGTLAADGRIAYQQTALTYQPEPTAASAPPLERLLGWILRTTLDTDATPHEVVSDGHSIYMRCSSAVVAWDRAAKAPRWMASFKDHGQCPDIVLVDGAVIVCLLARKAVVAYDAATGEVRWRLPEGWIFERKSAAWRGLHVSHEQDPGPFVVVDPRTGERSEMGMAPTTWEMIGVAGRIVLGSRDGVYISGETDLELTRCVDCVGAGNLTSDGRNAYFMAFNDDKKACVGWVDVLQPDRQGLFCFGGEKLEFYCAPDSEPGVVWVRDRDAKWLALIDIPGNREVWRLQRPDQHVDRIAATPHGLLALGSTGDKTYLRYIYEVDPDKGLVLAPFDDGQTLARSLHYVDGYLLVGRVKNLVSSVDVYEWTEGAEATLPRRSAMAAFARAPEGASRPQEVATVRDDSALSTLVREFAEIMRLSESARGPRAAAFNKALDAHLAAHPAESVGTFAMQVALAGGDKSLHGAVLGDLIQLRVKKP